MSSYEDDSNSNDDNSNWNHVLLKPAVSLLNAALHVDDIASLNVQTILRWTIL